MSAPTPLWLQVAALYTPEAARPFVAGTLPPAAPVAPRHVLESAALGRAHISWRARSERAHGARVWRLAQDGQATPAPSTASGAGPNAPEAGPTAPGPGPIAFERSGESGAGAPDSVGATTSRAGATVPGIAAGTVEVGAVHLVTAHPVAPGAEPHLEGGCAAHPVAPGAEYVRAWLAGWLGLGQPVPAEVLERAGAAVVGRLLDRGDARGVLSVRSGLCGGLLRAFDAWPNAGISELPLVLAGAVASRLNLGSGPMIGAGLTLAVIADGQLGWCPRATLSAYPHGVASEIESGLGPVAPAARAEAAAWLLWASTLVEGP